MAMMVHMEVQGKTQGAISKACSEKEGREDTIEVFELAQEITIPGTGLDGKVGGARIHKPLRITKAVDRSSPMLANALASNEALTVKLRFYRHSPSGDGVEQQFYTIELTDARINSYQAILPSIYDAATTELPPLEKVEFTFGKIKATYEPDGILFEDSWNKPRT